MTLLDKDKRRIFKEFDSYIRHNFADLPFVDYELPIEIKNKLEAECVNGKIPTLATVQSIVIELEHHLGYKNNTSIVHLAMNRKHDHAGIIEKSTEQFSDITLYHNPEYKAINYIAVLIHEVSHAFQAARGKPTYHQIEFNEYFTDALIVYLGLGNMYLNGIEKKEGTFDLWTLSYHSRTLKSGYLVTKDFPIIFELKQSLMNERRQQLLEKNEIEKLRKECNELTPIFNMYHEQLVQMIDVLKYRTELRRNELKVIKDAYFEYVNSDILYKINRIPTEVKNADIVKIRLANELLKRTLTNILKDKSSIKRISDKHGIHVY